MVERDEETTTLDSAHGVYAMAVAAELSGLDPQTLRLYERRGLLTPSRSSGGTRRYSDDDLTRLRRIRNLAAAGVNITGIAHILALQDRNTNLEHDNARLTNDQPRGRDTP